MISTPGFDPNQSLMKMIEAAEPSIYRRFVMDYTVGLGKICTEAELAIARRSPSWRREYCCEYGGYSGNIFSLDSIYRATEIECRKYDPAKDYIPNARHIVAVDPGYTDKSQFAVCVLQLSKGKAQVLFCDSWPNADFTKSLHYVVQLAYQQYKHCNGIYVDSANVPFIASLCSMVGQRRDYQEHLKQLNQQHPGIHPFRLGVKVLPFNFATEGATAVSNAKAWLDDERNMIQIHPDKFTKLIDSLKSATMKSDGYQLDKSSTLSRDCLDVFRMCLSYIPYQAVGASNR